MNIQHVCHDPPGDVFAPHTICQHLDCVRPFLLQAQLKTSLCDGKVFLEHTAQQAPLGGTKSLPTRTFNTFPVPVHLL